MNKRSCDTCEFLGKYNDDFHTVCRRYPPVKNKSDRECWPSVYPSDWCGEWQPNDKHRAALAAAAYAEVDP